MLRAQGNTNPGRLDRRVTLQYSVPTRDAAGGESLTWYEVATVWAEQAQVDGGRLYAAEAKHYESGLVYRIRHRTDVAAGQRLIHGDDMYEITAVEPIARRSRLELAVRGIDRTPGDSVLALDLGDSALVPIDLGDGSTPIDLGRAA